MSKRPWLDKGRSISVQQAHPADAQEARARLMRTTFGLSFMTNHLAFRPAEENDSEAISDLVRRNICPETLPGWNAAAIEDLANNSTPQVVSLSLRNTAFANVCIVDDSIIGFINCESPRTISLLVVDPSVQRTGIGTRLLARALEHITITASDVSVVEVTATEYSMPFYRRHSFYPISEPIEFKGRRVIRMAFWRKNPLLSVSPGKAVL